MHRFFAAISVSGPKLSDPHISRLIEHQAGERWSVAYSTKDALVLHAGPPNDSIRVHSLHAERGAIVGRLFKRGSSTSKLCGIDFNHEESDRIIASGGSGLVKTHWGSYFAIIRDRDQSNYHLFCDPANSWPCYHTSFKGVELLFSHVEDCIRFAPICFSVDQKHLARWLVFSGLTGSRCGLEEVRRVLGGERITVSAKGAVSSRIWDPVAIARYPLNLAPREAATQLRAVVEDTVHSLASPFDSITLKLSGGLDSAIVAGCLASAPSTPDVTYLNLSADVASGELLHLPGVDNRAAAKLRAIAGKGDERYFARLVAERWQKKMLERERAATMDLKRLWEAPLGAYPSMYFTAMDVDDIELECINQLHTPAFFSGQAGDSVFMATMQLFPATDYAFLHGLDRNLWSHMLASARLSRDSIWRVIRATIRYGAMRRRFTRPLPYLARSTGLSRELIASLNLNDFKDEFAASELDLPPGKTSHLTGLAGSLFSDFVFRSGDQTSHIDPLNSQPVWEFMLQVPSYIALTGGVSRGLARLAFADVLPAEIRMRQIKGTGTAFYQTVVRRNRPLLREVLLSGNLARDGFIDSRMLESLLSADEPFVSIDAVQLLILFSTEIWLHKWKDAHRMQAAA